MCVQNVYFFMIANLTSVELDNNKQILEIWWNILFFLSIQNRRTRISIPETKTPDHDIDTLDLGDYAEVGLLATDNEGNPITGRRDLYLQVCRNLMKYNSVSHRIYSIFIKFISESLWKSVNWLKLLDLWQPSSLITRYAN